MSSSLVRPAVDNSTPNRGPESPLYERTQQLARKAFAHAPSLSAKVLWDAVSIARAQSCFDEADGLVNALESRSGETGKSLEERARIAFARGDTELALDLLTLRAKRAPSASASV